MLCISKNNYTLSLMKKCIPDSVYCDYFVYLNGLQSRINGFVSFGHQFHSRNFIQPKLLFVVIKPGFNMDLRIEVVPQIRNNRAWCLFRLELHPGRLIRCYYSITMVSWWKVSHIAYTVDFRFYFMHNSFSWVIWINIVRPLIKRDTSCLYIQIRFLSVLFIALDLISG